ncbi:hypothetical protein J8F10_33460 [Gemmata sp. G18]|uniref:Secreted protein n=1 Tax=Gemmata palustris TaxID=2822762 RepID=A0ABS5C2I4_9BACT|nr:hypothetical protein [Gemmata palustris]MBP3960161.1 hypothetical protein [Gemmata palustris]
MTTPAQPRPARLAADVAKSLVLSEPAKALLSPAHTPRQFFDALAAHSDLAEDAIRFLAAALPKREGVWWALGCVRSAFPKPAPEAARAITAADAWVKEPTEVNRRACGDAASAADHGTAAGCLAAAAFWSGGSLAPPHLAAVPPRDDLTATAISAAVLLSAVVDVNHIAASYAKFLALGADIASGKARL